MIKDIGINKSSPWDDEEEAPKRSHNSKKENFFDNNIFDFNKFSDKKPPFKMPPVGENIWKFVLLAFFGLWLASGVYTVQEGEVALVLRFGKYVRSATTGLNYRLPSPIENVLIDSIEKIRRVEIGFRSGSNVSQRNFIQSNIVRTNNSNIAISEESLMLTGDENILDINFVVQWKISNLKDFAFNVANPEETVKSAAESSMREVIANSKLAVALTDGRSKIQQEAKELLQNMLNSYNAGIEITALQMQKVDPPSEVTDAFRDVQTAKTDKERLINEAYAFKNDLLPRARGDAAQLIQEGTAYKKEVTERALGDVSRFNAIYAEFRKAGDVTKKRIYFETMETVLKNMDKMIIDNKNSGVVPYLPLPNLSKQ